MESPLHKVILRFLKVIIKLYSLLFNLYFTTIITLFFLLVENSEIYVETHQY